MRELINFSFKNSVCCNKICHFNKSLESPWDLNQHLLREINIYITMKKITSRYQKEKLTKNTAFQPSVLFYRRSV